ncbi:hypothetical protein LZ31DRAFT_329926 [Colletotrichum somersetense]|nr:hypothetical protein LZ31DRAFT_329926 [Colletotrichum somersetense]
MGKGSRHLFLLLPSYFRASVRQPGCTGSRLLCDTTAFPQIIIVLLIVELSMLLLWPSNNLISGFLFPSPPCRGRLAEDRKTQFGSGRPISSSLSVTCMICRVDAEN